MRTLTASQLAAQAGLRFTSIVRLVRRPAQGGTDRYDLTQTVPWSIPSIIMGSAPIAIAATSATLTVYAVVAGQIRATTFAGNPPVQGPTTIIAAATNKSISAATDGTNTALVLTANFPGSATVQVYVDTGSGFGAPETVTFSDVVQAASCAWSNNGRLLIAATVINTGNFIAARIRTAPATYSAQVNTAMNSLTAPTGIACAYTTPAGTGDWALVASGKNPPTSSTTLNELRTLVFGDGALVAAGTFSTPTVAAAAPAPTASQPGTIFTATGLTLDAASVLRWSYLEDFKNTAAAGFETLHTYLGTARTPADFLAGFMQEPTPQGTSSLNTLSICTDRATGRIWAATNSLYAYADPPQDADHSARLLQLHTTEQESGARARVVLDNSDGSLTPLLTPNLVGQRLSISPGYQTAAAGNEYSSPAPYWLAQAHALCDGAGSVVELDAVDAWHLLQLFHPRRAQVWQAGSLTIAQMLQWILARLGLAFTPPGSPSTLLGSKPAFSFPPALSAAAAIHQLLDHVPEVMRLTTAGAVLSLPLATDAAVYSYTPQSHPIIAGRLAQLGSSLNHVLLFGKATPGSLVPTLIADAFDPADALRVTELPHLINDTQVSLANAQTEADTALRKAQLITDAGEIATAPNIGLELWDPIALTYPQLGWTAKRLRVREIQTIFDRISTAGGIFTQSTGLMNL